MPGGHSLDEMVAAIARYTGQMWAAAQAGDWEGLLQLERQRAPLFAQWAQLPIALPALLRPTVEAVLTQETDIRQMVAARQESIKDELAHFDNRRKLKNAYGI